MKKVLIAVCVILLMLGVIWFIDKMDQYDTNAVCYSIRNGIATFETESGNLYEWNLGDKDHVIEGNAYVLVMKDYENGNPLDDAIVRIIK